MSAQVVISIHWICITTGIAAIVLTTMWGDSLLSAFWSVSKQAVHQRQSIAEDRQKVGIYCVETSIMKLARHAR